jgi:prophage regulatory protein
MQSAETKAPDSILRIAEVKRRTGDSTSGIYDKMAKGTFPRPVKISERAVGWLESEINELIEQRRAARDARAQQP